MNGFTHVRLTRVSGYGKWLTRWRAYLCPEPATGEKQRSYLAAEGLSAATVAAQAEEILDALEGVSDEVLDMLFEAWPDHDDFWATLDAVQAALE